MADRWSAGVIPYAEMGYWQPDYEPQDTDLLCAFRVTPQDGVPPEEAGRKRFRLATDRGTDCAVSLERDEDLVDGALLYLDQERAIVARFGRERLWRLRPVDAAAALRLGWNAGNLHWRVRFQGEVLFVALEGRPEDYTARLGDMISERRVGVSILDEEGDGGKADAQAGENPFPATDHSHHNGR